MDIGKHPLTGDYVSLPVSYTSLLHLTIKWVLIIFAGTNPAIPKQ